MQTVRKVIPVVLLWLLVVNIFGLTVLNRFNLSADNAYVWINPNEFVQQKSWNILDLHNHWDSFWYLDIAQNGYSYKGEDKLSNIAFFPTYPFLIKLTSYLTLGNYVLSGWIISTIFLFLACWMLYKLVKQFHPNIDPLEVVMLLLIFPTAFFLNVIYTESLFLFLSLGVFYFALKKNFLYAAFLGVCFHTFTSCKYYLFC